MMIAATVAAWWIFWDLAGRSDLPSVLGRGYLHATPMLSTQNWRFWLPPAISLAIVFFLNAEADKRLLRLKWTTIDTLKQVGWKLLYLVFPLLMLANAFELLSDKKPLGFAWVLLAGLTRRIGMACLRLTSGIKFHPLKAGETRNRALRVAGRMGVELRNILLVPAGKGHSKFAFGMSNAIGLTDNLGRFLNGGELEFVIAHEVAHVKLRHPRWHSILVAVMFVAVSCLLYLSGLPLGYLRLALHLVALFLPLLIFYYASRRSEYAASHQAVLFTQSPENAIRAQYKLHQVRELPTAANSFLELFDTHPTLDHCVSAIARAGNLPAERLASLRHEYETDKQQVSHK